MRCGWYIQLRLVSLMLLKGFLSDSFIYFYVHLYDTWGLRNVHGFESGLVGLEGGGGDLNNVI